MTAYFSCCATVCPRDTTLPGEQLCVEFSFRFPLKIGWSKRCVECYGVSSFPLLSCGKQKMEKSGHPFAGFGNERRLLSLLLALLLSTK